MASSEFTLKGEKEMAGKLQQLANRMPRKFSNALFLEAERVMTKAKRDHVPVDANTLRSSGRVHPPEVSGGNTGASGARLGADISVRLTFGDASSPYAAAVHEHPSPASPPSWQGKPIEEILSVRDRKTWSQDGRGPKYLERPLNAAIPGMAERIAKAVAP